jgi:hypothetical protein
VLARFLPLSFRRQVSPAARHVFVRHIPAATIAHLRGRFGDIPLWCLGVICNTLLYIKSPAKLQLGPEGGGQEDWQYHVGVP